MAEDFCYNSLSPDQKTRCSQLMFDMENEADIERYAVELILLRDSAAAQGVKRDQFQTRIDEMRKDTEKPDAKY